MKLKRHRKLHENDGVSVTSFRMESLGVLAEEDFRQYGPQLAGRGGGLLSGPTVETLTASCEECSVSERIDRSQGVSLWREMGNPK